MLFSFLDVNELMLTAKQFKLYVDCLVRRNLFKGPILSLCELSQPRLLEVGICYTLYAKGLCAFPSYHDPHISMCSKPRS
jgi:hypothetical protein